MTPIEKFIKENYTPIIDEDKEGMKCVLKHKNKLTEDGVVYFHKWAKNKKKDVEYLIVDAHIDDICEFLYTYYNLVEDDKEMVKEIIVGMSIQKINGI
jgi:hypothetical protein